jgi:LysR family transcriptional regulator, hydrogen peroxide-inducible genes activator
MEIHQLRYFCAVARTGSFTRAAEQLGIAQPSLSQQIRVLEKQVSTPLFERLGRSVRLTAYGEALYQPALAILQQVTEAQAAIFELQQGVKGHLRIGVIPTIMPYLLAPHAGQFVERFPDLDVQFVEDTTPNLLERLQSGDLDIAVASLPVRNRDIVCSELFREPLLVALCDGHPLACTDSIDLQDLRDERLLVLKEGHCLHDDVLVGCTRHRSRMNPVFETDQMASIIELVRSGFGVTLLPAMAASHAAGCKLIPLKPDGFRRVGYLRARRHVVSKSMREFITWMRTLNQPEIYKIPRVRAS